MQTDASTYVVLYMRKESQNNILANRNGMHKTHVCFHSQLENSGESVPLVRWHGNYIFTLREHFHWKCDNCSDSPGFQNWAETELITELWALAQSLWSCPPAWFAKLEITLFIRSTDSHKWLPDASYWVMCSRDREKIAVSPCLWST